MEKLTHDFLEMRGEIVATRFGQAVGVEGKEREEGRGSWKGKEEEVQTGSVMEVCFGRFPDTPPSSKAPTARDSTLLPDLSSQRVFTIRSPFYLCRKIDRA